MGWAIEIILLLALSLISASAAVVNSIRTQKTDSKTSPVYYGAGICLAFATITMLVAMFMISREQSPRVAAAHAAAIQAYKNSAAAVQTP
jgi:hypothetical protein